MRSPMGARARRLYGSRIAPEPGLRRQDPAGLRERRRGAGARGNEARRDLRPARPGSLRRRERRRDPLRARSRALLALGDPRRDARVGAGPEARWAHGDRVPQHPLRLPDLPREPAAVLARRPGWPEDHVGVLWRSQVERPAHDPSLGLHARLAEGASCRGGPRRRAPGARAIQGARAARHARGGSEAVTREAKLGAFFASRGLCVRPWVQKLSNRSESIAVRRGASQPTALSYLRSARFATLSSTDQRLSIA